MFYIYKKKKGGRSRTQGAKKVGKRRQRIDSFRTGCIILESTVMYVVAGKNGEWEKKEAGGLTRGSFDEAGVLIVGCVTPRWRFSGGVISTYMYGNVTSNDVS